MKCTDICIRKKVQELGAFYLSTKLSKWA